MGQDMPPVGGYEPIQYRRNIPARGFRPAYYLLAVGLISTYGMYWTGRGIREHKYVHTYHYIRSPCSVHSSKKTYWSKDV